MRLGSGSEERDGFVCWISEAARSFMSGIVVFVIVGESCAFECELRAEDTDWRL